MDALWSCQTKSKGVSCGHALTQKKPDACTGEHHVQTDAEVEEKPHQQRAKGTEHQRRHGIAWPKAEGHQPLEGPVPPKGEQSGIAG